MFTPVLETKPLTDARQIKVGDTLRTHYGEDLVVQARQSKGKNGVEIKAERFFEGESTGEVTLTLGRGYDVTWVRGYKRPGHIAVWERVRVTRINGHLIEMFLTVWGKGRNKLTNYEIERDHEHAGYAVNPEDAEVNYKRVCDGYIRDRSTGDYVKAGS